MQCLVSRWSAIDIWDCSGNTITDLITFGLKAGVSTSCLAVGSNRPHQLIRNTMHHWGRWSAPDEDFTLSNQSVSKKTDQIKMYTVLWGSFLLQTIPSLKINSNPNNFPGFQLSLSQRLRSYRIPIRCVRTHLCLAKLKLSQGALWDINWWSYNS